jgi:AraC-like DNA-binding protein
MTSRNTFEVTRRGAGRWLMCRPEQRGDGVLIVLVEKGTAAASLGGLNEQLQAGQLHTALQKGFDTVVVDEESSVVVAWLSLDECRLPNGAERLTTTVTPGTTSALLRHVLVGLSIDARVGGPPPSPRVARQVGDLVSAVVAERRHSGSDTSDLFDAAARFIERHLYDDSLSQDQIAAALSVSTRTLHRVFRSRGATVASWVRERRLEQCRLDLEDSRLAHVPVSALAARWGLTDAAHFSRLFKSRYGAGPRAFRTLAHANEVEGSRRSNRLELMVAV